jgi:hypothetical protein
MGNLKGQAYNQRYAPGGGALGNVPMPNAARPNMYHEMK